MKYIVTIFLSISSLACQKYSGEVNFKLPEVPYATGSQTGATGQPTNVNKKEFIFPEVPYAQ